MDIIWNEATDIIKRLKQLQPVKAAFLAIMGLSDWNEAEKSTSITRCYTFIIVCWKGF